MQRQARSRLRPSLRGKSARGTLELQSEENTRLASDQLRASLASAPPPTEIADALGTLENVDPECARRLPVALVDVAERNLAMFVCETETARDLVQERIEDLAT